MPSKEELYDEAIELQQQGKMEEAIAKLRQLAADEPAYALAYAALGVFMSRLDRHDEAIEHARKVCELEPQDPFSFVAMSLICQKAGNNSEAEQAMIAAQQAEIVARQEPSE